jgi:serine/threonine-protein kinase
MTGRVLDGRYRIGVRIARGGMASVYEAVDLRLERTCAVKIMHAELAEDEDFAARFVREARSAARISHPHVVSVFDQGNDSGTLFLAMEHIPGHTLRDVIRKESPMPASKALGLLDPVLSALAAAHADGTIHRDMKPENVLLADDGRIKVADFGLARAVSADTQHTATGGVLIGTVSYLSPELVIDGRADARADVYAVGVMLYEMLTGRKPHEGESPLQVAYKHVHNDVPAPSLLVPGIPPYVDALVARATARDRDLRPADARVLLHQVRRVRGALDHRVADDPDLTADLSPNTAALDLSSIDYVREDADHRREHPPRLVEPAEAPAVLAATSHGAAPPGGRDDTTVLSGATSAAPTRRRRSRRVPLLLGLVVLVLAGVAAAGWYLTVGRSVPTPSVTGLTAARAEAKVEAEGLQFQVAGRDYSETVAEGSVIATDPPPGSDVPVDGTVAATLSRGPERYEVPRLVGLDADRAVTALEDSNLRADDLVERYDERVEEGVVVSSDPETGAVVKPDTGIDLVVSRGPEPIKVPDLAGTNGRQARADLRELGFKVDVTREHSDDVPQGDVLSQAPDSGTLFRGDRVSLVVSKGPVLVTVPDVTRLDLEAATAEMAAAGLDVTTIRSELYVGLDIVVGSDPGGGSQAPRGSTVTLSLV